MEKFGSEFSEVQDMIMNNAYVDDILHSTDSVKNAFNLIKKAEDLLTLENF